MSDLIEKIKVIRYGETTPWEDRLTYGRAIGVSLNLGNEADVGFIRDRSDLKPQGRIPHITDLSVISFKGGSTVTVQLIPNDSLCTFHVHMPGLSDLSFSKSIRDLKAEVIQHIDQVGLPGDRFEILAQKATEWSDIEILKWYGHSAKQVSQTEETYVDPELYGKRSNKLESDIVKIINYDASAAVLSQRADKILNDSELFTDKGLRIVLTKMLRTGIQQDSSVFSRIAVPIRTFYYLKLASINQVSEAFKKQFSEYSFHDRAALIYRLCDIG